MPLGIGAIGTVVAIGVVAVIAMAHAIGSWGMFEIEVHRLRIDAKRLKDEFEARKNRMLDDDLVEQDEPMMRRAA